MKHVHAKYVKMKWLLVISLFAVLQESEGGTITICEGHSGTLTCSGPMTVTYASYGRLEAHTCGTNYNTNCHASSSFSVASSTCNGRTSCTISSTNGVFGDPCVGTYKYLRVTWSCAVNGNWGSWGSYGSCSKSCGSGTQSRSRSCNNPAPSNGGSSCSGSSTSTTSCNTHSCPIHGGWTNWSSWGSCTKSCGSGTQSKSRSCTNPSPQHGGNSCSGSTSTSQSCNTHNCPIHGGWTSWSSWGSCSLTCGGGTQSKSRSCTNPSPQYGGNSCSGSTSASQSCNTHNCPIDGGWTSWTSWGTCSLTCGGGSQSKTRSCTNPSPQYGGASCSGATSASQSCNTHNCPIDGGWASWTSWGTCTVTCGGGTQDRSRTCTNPSPQYGGAQCPNSASSTQDCNTHHCPIDGEWASWTSWTTCTETCGGGIQSKSRTCTNPSPQYGGAYCPDYSSNTQACNTHNCPIDGAWTSWSSWATCSLTCGGGSQGRSRSCTNPSAQYGGASCSGAASATQSCNVQNCPIDGSFGSWTAWGSCTVTCGGGTQEKTRACDSPTPQYGGALCVGASSDTQTCNTQVCIIDGNWGAWGAWGTCSVTCGGGVYSRSRVCNDPAPANGGLDCPGSSGDFGDCNSAACATVAPGTYQQICPVGWFTCQSGTLTCIDASFQCDCANDCDDGSDESEGYGGCSMFCPSGAPGTHRLSLLLTFLCVLITTAHVFRLI